MSEEKKPTAVPPALPPGEDVQDIFVEEIADRVVNRLEAHESISASRFSGPVPSAAQMKEYAEIDPDFPKKFFEILEKQQDHDHAVENSVIEINKEIAFEHQALERRGQTFGFVLAAGGLVAGVITAALGSPLAGGIIGSGGIAVLAGVFVYGARKNMASLQLKDPASDSDS